MALLQISFVICALGLTGVLSQDCNQCTTQKYTDTPCKNMVAMLTCLAASENSCSLEETGGVTFKQVIEVIGDSCEAFLPLIHGGGDTCDALTTCLKKTKFVFLLDVQMSNESLKTGFWCRTMDEVMNCAITTTGECKVANDRVDKLQEASGKIKEVCFDGTASIHGETMTMVLALSAAAVVLRLISG